jgi:hypothetical protein
MKKSVKSTKIRKIRKNQKVRKKSETCSNFRNFPDFSEDLVTLIPIEVKFGQCLWKIVHEELNKKKI